MQITGYRREGCKAGHSCAAMLERYWQHKLGWEAYLGGGGEGGDGGDGGDGGGGLHRGNIYALAFRVAKSKPVQAKPMSALGGFRLTPAGILHSESWVRAVAVGLMHNNMHHTEQ